MPSYRTVIHIPVTVAANSLADAAQLIELIRDELALEAEKIGLAEGEVIAGEPTTDAVTDAYQAPTASSNAAAAGWADEPGWRCIHHGHESDTEPCPDCHPNGITLPAATITDSPAWGG